MLQNYPLLQCRQEALRAAISEKDANLALLEMAAPKPNHPRAIEDIKRLRKEKEDLMKKLKEEVKSWSIVSV